MGEVADMMLDGVLCELCGEYLGEGWGAPRICAYCKGGDPEGEYDEIGGDDGAERDGV